MRTESGRRNLLLSLCIIATVPAMLVQILSSVQNKTICASNLRQLGAAFAQYAQDEDGHFPSPGGGTAPAWDGVDPQTHQRNGVTPYLGKLAPGANPFVCPNIEGTSLAVQPVDSSSYVTNFARSYGMNEFLRDSGVVTIGSAQYLTTDTDAYNPAIDVLGYKKLNKLQGGIKRSAIPYPAKTVLLFEGIPIKSNDQLNGSTGRAGAWGVVGGYFRTQDACDRRFHALGQTCQTPGVTAWHDGENNYLYCDGHIASHPPVQEGWTPTRQDPGDFLLTHCRQPQAPCP